MNNMLWIYKYEDAPEASSYTQLCQAAWNKYSPKQNITYIDKNTINTFIPEILRIESFIQKDSSEYTEIHKILVATLLLHKFGGIFVAPHIFPLKNFSSFFTYLNNLEYFMFGQEKESHGNFCLEVCGSLPGHSVINSIQKNLLHKVQTSAHISLENISEIIEPLQHNIYTKLYLNRRDVCLNITQVTDILFKDAINETSTEALYLAVSPELFKEVDPPFSTMSAAALLNSGTQLGKLLRSNLDPREFSENTESDSIKIENWKRILQHRKIPFHTPAKVLYREPNKKNSSLKIATIVEEKRFFELEYEADLIPLTPANYALQLVYNRPDFILIESFWRDSTGTWGYAFSPQDSHYSDLCNLLSLAKENNIPTVFWQTKGIEYHDIYAHLAPLFTKTFCADPKECEVFTQAGTDADELLPCIQPAICNPFKPLNENIEKLYPLLFDGIGDMRRFPELTKFLQEFIHLGLHCLESRGYLTQNSFTVWSETSAPYMENRYLGYTDMWGRQATLKEGQVYLATSLTQESPTAQLWKIMEVAGTHVPVVYYGDPTHFLPEKGLLVYATTQEDCLIEVTAMQKDSFYAQRLAHKAWRLVHSKHTFSHRLQTICSLLGIAHDWTPHPKASLVSPTMRAEMLEDIFQSYDRQTYPNKELIIVCHGFPARLAEEKIGNRPNVTVCSLPADLYVGSLLNWGNNLATGDYVFRIDDDDIYFAHYIEDMLLSARSIDADIFGKNAKYVSFDNQHLDIANRISCMTASQSSEADSWRISGNTLSGKKSFIIEKYPEDCNGSADSIVKICTTDKALYAVTDDLNMVILRKENEFHTWQISDKFKKTLNKTDININTVNI